MRSPTSPICLFAGLVPLCPLLNRPDAPLMRYWAARRACLWAASGSSTASCWRQPATPQAPTWSQVGLHESALVAGRLSSVTQATCHEATQATSPCVLSPRRMCSAFDCRQRPGFHGWPRVVLPRPGGPVRAHQHRLLLLPGGLSPGRPQHRSGGACLLSGLYAPVQCHRLAWHQRREHDAPH